jgi:hypothetical protein
MRTKWIKLSGVCLGTAILCTAIVQPLSSQSGRGAEIARTDGRELVVRWLAHLGYPTRSPHFLLDEDPDLKYFPDFYFFSAAFEQDQTAPSIGHFAVNRVNADLWDPMSCKKLHSRIIGATQRALRKQIGLSSERAARAAKMAPCTGPTE